MGRDPGRSRQYTRILIPGWEAFLVSMVMAGLLYPLKVQLQSSSPVEFFNKGSKYHEPKWLLKEPQGPSFQNLVRPHSPTLCRVWTVCLGELADSVIGKNSLAKLGFSCFRKAIWPDNIGCTDPQHTTDTQTHRDWLSASHVHWES